MDLYFRDRDREWVGDALRVCWVERKRERKEKGGGKRENKMGKYVFGMERKVEGRETWKQRFVDETHQL